MVSKDLIPHETHALAHPLQRDELDAFNEARPEELILPVKKLVQAVSRQADSRHAGEFYDTLTETYQPELLMALLAMSRSRSLFARVGFDDPPVCSSDDAVAPRQSVEHDGMYTGPTCNECPFSQWGTAKGGEGKGQECRFTYNLLGFDLNEKQPFILRVSGTSINPWRKFMTVGKFGSIPAYALELRVSAGPEKFDAGQAWVMKFKSGGPLPPDLAAAMKQQAANYRGINMGVEEVVEEAPFE